MCIFGTKPVPSPSLPQTLSPYSMIVPIKQNGDRDIIGKLNEAIKVMGKEEEKEESFSEGH